MFAIPDAPGVFCDAHLVVDGRPYFLSLWGRDTGIQALQARLSLSVSEGGMDTMTIGESGDAGAVRVAGFDPKRLSKQTARQPVAAFGELVNLWLFDELLSAADRANHRAMLLLKDNPRENDERLWALLKQTLWIPVVDAWQYVIVSEFVAREWITPMSGHKVNAWYIDLSDEEAVEAAVSSWLREGRLLLD